MCSYAFYRSLPVDNIAFLDCKSQKIALAGTWLVMDGEVLPYERMFAELHPGLCKVIVAP